MDVQEQESLAKTSKESMSGGSDNLAPIVATVLRERTVHGMEKEIDELHSKYTEFER